MKQTAASKSKTSSSDAKGANITNSAKGNTPPVKTPEAKVVKPAPFKDWKVLLPDSSVITNETKIKRNGEPYTVKDENELCRLIKVDWCKRTNSKSFKDWAVALNKSKEFEGSFTKLDALDNMASLYQVNVNGKHVNLYDFYLEHNSMHGVTKLKKRDKPVTKLIPGNVKEQKKAAAPVKPESAKDSTKAPATNEKPNTDALAKQIAEAREKQAAKKKAKQTLAKKLVAGRPALVVKPGMSGKALQKKVAKLSTPKA